jgi:hypothetical protein
MYKTQKKQKKIQNTNIQNTQKYKIHKNTKTQKHKNTKTQKHKNTKTQKHKNTKTQKQYKGIRKEREHTLFNNSGPFTEIKFEFASLAIAYNKVR